MRVECDERDIDAVVEVMQRREAGLAAALPVGDKRGPIPDKKVAPVYVALKMLSEI